MLQHQLLLRRCSPVCFHLLLASSAISVLSHYIQLRIRTLSQMLWASTILPLKLRFGTHLTLFSFSLDIVGCLPLLLTCICTNTWSLFLVSLWTSDLFGYIAILWCWSHGLLKSRWIRYNIILFILLGSHQWCIVLVYGVLLNVAFTWETVASNFCHNLAWEHLLLAEFEEVEVLACWVKLMLRAGKAALVLALSWEWSVLFAGALDVHVSLMTNVAQLILAKLQLS